MKDQISTLRGYGWLSFLDRPAPAWVLALVTLFTIAASFAVFGRGITFTGIFLNDTFVFFDGIDRLSKGQIPHADFSTPVGYLGYYLPYLGNLIVGGFSGAIEFASLLLGALAGGTAAVLLWRRAGLGFSLLILAVVMGIIVVPIVPGWRGADVSHAMHYNRWCWGLLTVLFILALRPPVRGLPPAATGLLGAAVLLTMFFIKVSYFAVGCAFLVLLAIYPDQRRTEALSAGAGMAIGICLIWLMQPPIVGGYLADILLALESGEDMQRSYLDIVIGNRKDVGLLLLAFGVSLFARAGGWRGYVVFGFVASSGIAILSQNFQFVFVVTFVSAFAILAPIPGQANTGGRIAHALILVAAFGMVFPFAKEWVRTAVRYIQPAEAGEFATIDDARFESMFVSDRTVYRYSPPKKHDATSLTPSEWLRSDVPVFGLTETEYVAALEDAVRMVDENQARGRPILTLDFTNAVPMLVDAPRISGGYSWLHLGRNVSAQTLPEGPDMFAGFEYVIIPFGSLTEQKTTELRAVFGPYLAEHAQTVARSDHWLLLRLQ